MKLHNLIYGLIVFLALMSCDSNRVFEENHNFPGETWNRDSVLVFNVNITDTLAVYNIYMNNRISGQYDYSNLYLFIDIELPNHKVKRDTIECLLREPGGKPLGKGFGNIWSNRTPYHENIRFPFSGTYKFTIEQAMRVDELHHVVDAGMRVEKAKI